MTRLEQFEIWELTGGRWQLVASFKDFDLARAMAQRRRYRMRLVRLVYENGEVVQREVLTEIGATRQQP